MGYFDFGKMWKVHYHSLILIFYGFSLDIHFFNNQKQRLHLKSQGNTQYCPAESIS